LVFYNDNAHGMFSNDSTDFLFTSDTFFIRSGIITTVRLYNAMGGELTRYTPFKKTIWINLFLLSTNLA